MLYILLYTEASSAFNLWKEFHIKVLLEGSILATLFLNI